MENSIKESIERLKLCSTNQCHICGRYEKEECMLERNRCEQHILSEYKKVLKENEQFKKENEKLKYKIEGQECVIETQAHNEEVYERIFERLEKENKELKNALNVEQK